jgi:hypothetical protein
MKAVGRSRVVQIVFMALTRRCRFLAWFSGKSLLGALLPTYCELFASIQNEPGWHNPPDKRFFDDAARGTCSLYVVCCAVIVMCGGSKAYPFSQPRSVPLANPRPEGAKLERPGEPDHFIYPKVQRTATPLLQAIPHHSSFSSPLAQEVLLKSLPTMLYMTPGVRRPMPAGYDKG